MAKILYLARLFSLVGAVLFSIASVDSASVFNLFFAFFGAGSPITNHGLIIFSILAIYALVLQSSKNKDIVRNGSKIMLGLFVLGLVSLFFQVGLFSGYVPPQIVVISELLAPFVCLVSGLLGFLYLRNIKQ